MTRVHMTGDRPENPWVDDVVRFISDIREEPAPEDQEGTEPRHWSFVVDETISKEEWTARKEAALAEARAVTTAYELILEALAE